MKGKAQIYRANPMKEFNSGITVNKMYKMNNVNKEIQTELSHGKSIKYFVNTSTIKNPMIGTRAKSAPGLPPPSNRINASNCPIEPNIMLIALSTIGKNSTIMKANNNSMNFLSDALVFDWITSTDRYMISHKRTVANINQMMNIMELSA